MNILFCNKYFFLNGGTEKYLKAMMDHLAWVGHKPIPFSVRYANCWPSPYAEYFLKPPGSPEETHFRHLRIGRLHTIRLLDRAVYSVEARWGLSRLLSRLEKVDVAYLLNIYNYMSPSIIHTLKDRNIPVVLRLGDYNLLCPSYLFLRDGKPCQLCIEGDYFNGLRFRCVKGSFAASAIRVGSMYLHKWIKLYDLVDAFIVPSNFMKACLITGGFPEERIHVIRTPVFQQIESFEREKRHILYLGRISFEKGLDTLLTAYQRAGIEPELVLAGRSFDGEQERLKELILPRWRHRIHFVGFQEGRALEQLMSEALFTVTPSRWYDNAPQSIYESLACGAPVVASRIGAIPEQVLDGTTGKLFPPDNVDALADALRWMVADLDRLKWMGREGKRFIATHHTVDRHLTELLELFSSLIERNRQPFV